MAISLIDVNVVFSPSSASFEVPSIFAILRTLFILIHLQRSQMTNVKFESHVFPILSFWYFSLSFSEFLLDYRSNFRMGHLSQI